MNLTDAKLNRMYTMGMTPGPSAQDDRRFAARVLANPTKAVQWTKLAINVGLKPIAHTVLEASMAYEHLSIYTEDHKEAVAALREKRAPIFRGR